MQVEQDYKPTGEDIIKKIQEMSKMLKEEENKVYENLMDRKEEEENCKQGPGNGVGKHYSPASRKRYKQVRPYF